LENVMPYKLNADNTSLIRDPQYHKIVDLINNLVSSDAIMSSFAGNCIGTCDIVQSLLSQVGIPSKIVECQVNIAGYNDGGERIFYFVGYDNYNYPGQIDTHTVIVTESENPILIDLSLGKNLPRDAQLIIERVGADKFDESGKEIIGKFKVKNIDVIYYAKKNLRLANIHQKNIVQRIVREQEFERTIQFVKVMLYFTLSLGCINFILNMTLIAIKVIEKL
jgi:hypothetical protein